MEWELNFLHFLQGLHQPLLDKLMIVLTMLGDNGIFWIVLALLLLCIKKYRKCGVGMLISLFVMLIIGDGLLKHLFMRTRPCFVDTSVVLLIKAPGGYSFPSGHTFAGFAAASTMFLYHKKEGIAALVLAALIAFSRMYLFVHFPTDVLASVVLGICDALLVWFLMQQYEIRKIDKTAE